MPREPIVFPARTLVTTALLLAGVAASGTTSPATAFSLTSSAFTADATIPQQFTCDGRNSSPPLTWQDPPDATKAFALTVDDPDAPGGSWAHWVLYDIPAKARALSEDAPKGERLSDGSVQGRNDFRNFGWGGPCPPRGDSPHRYVFTLYALDGATALAPFTTKTQLLQAINKHTLAQATLTARYGR